MKISIITIGICCLFLHYASAQKDTTVIVSQKGFLFLTNYNFQYDYHGEEINPLGFHDFFFPSEHFDSTCLTESNRAIAFKNGVRIDYIDNRLSLKKEAMLFKGVDTSYCYPEPQFYIIPVVISYKKFEDYWPYACRHNYFDIQVTGGSALHFEYIHYAIKPINIIPQFSKSKKRPGKKHKKTGN